MLGETDPRPPEAQPWYIALMAASGAVEALRHFAVGNTEIVSRVALLDDVVRSALHEPEAVAVRARSEQLRRHGYGVVIEHLGAKFGLRLGLDVESATDLLLSFGGTSLYRSLVLDYGWATDQFIDWLARTLTEQLVDPSRSGLAPGC